MATASKPSFSLRAASRMPTLGKDYDPVTHRYSSEYINPNDYVLVIDAFPGKDVIIPVEDQQLRPGEDPKKGATSRGCGCRLARLRLTSKWKDPSVSG